MKYETIRRKQTADISQTSQGMGYSRAVQYRSGLSYLPGVQVEDHEDDFEDEVINMTELKEKIDAYGIPIFAYFLMLIAIFIFDIYFIWALKLLLISLILVWYDNEIDRKRKLLKMNDIGDSNES